MRVCSFCNGLQMPGTRCPFCRLPLVDGGPVADYYGPYSLYADKADEYPGCMHLLYCPRCGFDCREYSPQTEI